MNKASAMGACEHLSLAVANEPSVIEIWQTVGVWAGAAGSAMAAIVALVLASIPARPKLRARCIRIDDSETLQGISWEVDIANAGPINVRIVKSEFERWAPKASNPFRHERINAPIIKANLEGPNGILMSRPHWDPVPLLAFQTAKVWTLATGLDPTKQGWAPRATDRTIRLILTNATGEKFRVKPPPDWRPLRKR